MRKTGKTFFAMALSALMALAPIANAAPVFADGETPTHTVTYDANGGQFKSGSDENKITYSGVATQTKDSESENLNSDGEVIKTGSLAPLAEKDAGTAVLVDKTAKSEKDEYKTLLGATITAKWQTGTMYTLDLVDEDNNSIIEGTIDSTKVNEKIFNVNSVVKLVLTAPEKNATHKDAENDYYGHYVKSVAYYTNLKYGTIETPTREGYIFKEWTSDKDGKTAIDPATFSKKEAITFYAQWEKDPNAKDKSDDNQDTQNDQNQNNNNDDNNGQDENTTNKNASFKILVADSESDDAIPGVALTLDKGDKQIEATTGSDGYASFDDVEAGDYNVSQSGSVEGYQNAGVNGNIGIINVKTDGTVGCTGDEIVDTNNDNTFKIVLDKTPAEAEVYTIECDPNGGVFTDGETNSKTITYTSNDETFTLNDKVGVPSRDGYVFDGWVGTDEDTPNTSVSISKGSTGNREYTASWTANEDDNNNQNDNQNDNQNNNNQNNNQGSDQNNTNNSDNTSTGDDGEDSSVETGSLVLKNVVTGTGANLDKKFKFTITLENNGSPVNASYDCSGVKTGKIVFKNGTATVKLANDESITITGIPKGYVVTIDQEEAKGYSTKPSSRHASGTMTSGKLTATFTNEKTSSDSGSSSSDSTTDSKTKANLTFTHVTTGEGADKDKKFVYTLTVKNGTTPVTGSYSYTGTGTGTVAFSSEGKISFTMKDGQTLTIQDLPTGVTYAISKNDSNDGYTLTKSKEDGTLTADTTVTLTETKGSVTGDSNSKSDSSKKDAAKDAKNAKLSDVKTGDNLPVLPLTIAAVVALAVIAIAVMKKSKKDEK